MGCCVIYSLTKAKSDLREKLLDKDKFYKKNMEKYKLDMNIVTKIS